MSNGGDILFNSIDSNNRPKSIPNSGFKGSSKQLFCAYCMCRGDVDSVTGICEILPLLQKLKYIWQFLGFI